MNCYGVDYSESQIETANKAIPQGHFFVEEAIKLSLPNTEFDIIFSHSVFQYFPNDDYVEEVLTTWCKQIKKGGKLVLMDLNDASLEEVYHSERMLAYKTSSEYQTIYKDLNHLFLDKKSLSQRLESLGMLNVEFFPHAVCN